MRIILCFLLILHGVSVFAQSGQPSKKPMNVLFIAVDDLRPELGCYGQDHIISPNIDQLAASGMLFERAYVQQAVCAPSRISVLSGLRPDSTGIYDLNTPLSSVFPNLITLPTLFKQNGYQTISIGKVYHHPQDDPEAWSKPATIPNGDWQGRGYLSKEAISKVKPYAKEHSNADARGPAYESPDVPDNAYVDGMIADQAINEMNETNGRPFFLAVGFRKPHLPFNAPKKYWDLYDTASIQLPEVQVPPKDAPAFAEGNWRELRNYVDMPKEGPLSEEQSRKLIHGYYACVSYIDAQIGRLLSELDRLGLRENTVVVLWGDHGWKLGEYGAWCRHTNFELDTRAPLIMSVPGLPTKGQKTKALVEFVDIYPTLAELTGLPLPAHLQGTSVVPILNNPGVAGKNVSLSQYPYPNTNNIKIMGYTLRTDRYRFTRWQKFQKPDEEIALELYDHKLDPKETVNLATHPEYKNIVEKMMLLHRQSWQK